MPSAPETHALAKIDWQYLATLTFRGRVPSPPRAIRFAQEWLVGVAGVARVPFRRLLWVLRPEEGESFGRFHIHLLIAGVPFADQSFRFRIKAGWKHGFADIRAWESGLGGVAYVAKGLGGGGSDGDNVYESSKFVSHHNLILSESLARVVAASLVTTEESKSARQCENPRATEIAQADTSSAKNSLGSVQRSKDAGRFPLRPTEDPINGRWITEAANASSWAVWLRQRADITGVLKVVRA